MTILTVNEGSLIASLTCVLLQVKGKLLQQLRGKHVIVRDALLAGDAERELLGGALQEWSRTATGPVATSALEARLCLQRLLHTCHTYCSACLMKFLASCRHIFQAVQNDSDNCTLYNAA